MLRKSLIGLTIAVACMTAFAASAGRSAAAHGTRSHGSHENGTPRPEPQDIQLAISELRHSTARFHRLEVALQEGYAAFGGCFSDPAGGMGYHYANAELMEDPAVDPRHPELLLYEKHADGSMRFVGVEYLTFQAAWHAAGNRGLPRLFGQRFHLNTTLLDQPFYLLHVWQWKHNPEGRFMDWNPRVVCP
jgi:hypothetical protein